MDIAATAEGRESHDAERLEVMEAGDGSVNAVEDVAGNADAHLSGENKFQRAISAWRGELLKLECSSHLCC